MIQHALIHYSTQSALHWKDWADKVVYTTEVVAVRFFARKRLIDKRIYVLHYSYGLDMHPTVQPFNSCTSQLDVYQYPVVQTPIDNI